MILQTDECYDAECSLYIWYVDDVEVGRVRLPIGSIPAGTDETKLVFKEPEGFPWQGIGDLVGA